MGLHYCTTCLNIYIKKCSTCQLTLIGNYKQDLFVQMKCSCNPLISLAPMTWNCHRFICQMVTAKETDIEVETDRMIFVNYIMRLVLVKAFVLY